MRTRPARLTALAVAAAVALSGALSGALAASAAHAAPQARAAATGIDGNTISLAVTPAIPGETAVFQVRATGNVNASQSSNVYLSVTLAPAGVECYPTSALEQARAEQQSRDPRWAHWGAAYVGSNSPENVAYLEERVFSGRPAGAYRLCGYLRGQGQGPDPYVMERLDFTVGGTCTEAGAALVAAQQAATTATAAVAAARAKVAAKKKAFTQAKKSFKKKKSRNASAKALKKAKKKMLRKKSQWKKSKNVLASRRTDAAASSAALVAAQERYGLFC